METVRVAAAIIVENGRVLAAQRGSGAFKGGWEFPGGKLEPGETAAEACVREVREELNVSVKGLRLFRTVEHDYPEATPPFHLSMDCFLCRKASGEIRDAEHDRLLWLAPGDLFSVGWLPADTELVKELQAYLVAAQGRCHGEETCRA